jgi:hypothetical protein
MVGRGGSLRKQKAKIWVWNSWKSFLIIPDFFIKIAEVVLALAAIGVVVIAGVAINVTIGAPLKLLTYLIAIPLDYIFGANNTWKVLETFQDFLVSALMIAVAIAIVLPILAGIVAIDLALHLTMGVIGVVFGVITSPLSLMKDPHLYWMNKKKEILRAQRQQRQAASLAADQQQPSLSSPSTTLFMRKLFTFSFLDPDTTEVFSVRNDSVEGNFAEEKFNGSDLRRFQNFDPNNPKVAKCAISGRDLSIDDHEKKENTQEKVVKGSDGRYYFQHELDKRQKKDSTFKVSYTTADILPSSLRDKFIPNKTVCSLNCDTLPLYDDKGCARSVVRSLYGHYYNELSDKEGAIGIKSYVKFKPQCPVTRQYLDDAYLFRVAIPPAYRRIGTPPSVMGTAFSFFKTQLPWFSRANPSAEPSVPSERPPSP